MFDFFKSSHSSAKLDPVPLTCVSPGIVWEGCGTGRAYVVYLAKELECGLITFNHCASLSSVLEKNSGLQTGFVHDLRHSWAWWKLSPGFSINLGLSAPYATTWWDIRHFKIPFGRSTVNVFATDFSVSKVDGRGHFAGLAHCIEDLRLHQDRLDKLALDFEESCGGF